MRILLIEDEEKATDSIRLDLKTYYAIDIASTGEEGEYLTNVNEYDLIILDAILPDTDGATLCQKFRSAGSPTPILVLTNDNNLEEKIQVLNAGADDYLTKPCYLRELLARIRVLLRRAGTGFIADILAVDSLTLNSATRLVEHRGKKVKLRRKEFELLEYFLRNPGKVLTRSMILEHLWDNTADPAANIVDVHIKYLRDQIDRPFGTKLIKTVPGLGYKLES